MIPAAAEGNHDTAKLVSHCISGKNVAVLLVIFSQHVGVMVYLFGMAEETKTTQHTANRLREHLHHNWMLDADDGTSISDLLSLAAANFYQLHHTNIKHLN